MHGNGAVISWTITVQLLFLIQQEPSRELLLSVAAEAGTTPAREPAPLIALAIVSVEAITASDSGWHLPAIKFNAVRFYFTKRYFQI